MTLEISEISNEVLKMLHAQEETLDVSFWREIDDELNYRVEEGLTDWPY